MTSTSQHILVVANQTATDERLHRAICGFALDPAARIHVIAPALNSRLRHWFSDSDAAYEQAEARLGACIESLADLDFDVGGHVADEDPLQAIADALATFPATELIITTHPEPLSNWLAHDLVDRALARFGLPTIHVIADGSRTVRSRELAIAA